ncbi:tetratricopeptide repeat protein [Roseomonas sp. HF4]|uniref:tetratricopeptide repeat protein n=1 Tax=Roseomonas sp. HF4 TaxID=2562313 RepID=UPI001485A061|nr:tetratricopeptide repeat protein [Roseomonas sp. HF4]
MRRAAGRLQAAALVLLAVVVLGGCSALHGDVAVPTARPAPAESQDRARAASLFRDAQRTLNPPRGGTRDPDRAAALFEQAARLGHPEAQVLVALAHLSRGDGRRDTAAAIPWLNLAAHEGEAEAQFLLGRLLEAGDGTPRDTAWAALWFHRAAERGHPEAGFAMAMLQVAGEGTARDWPEALARFRLAERRGVGAARRYREALAPRVPPAEARQGAALLAGESARGAVPAVDRPLRRFAQSALARRGRWDAAVDGRDSPRLRAALDAFARDERIVAASPFDPLVIDRLRRPG